MKRKYTLTTLKGKVTKVYDGDTIDVAVKYGLFRHKYTLCIRFAGMDTPELSQNQHYAEEAKNYVIKRIFDEHVTVQVAILKGSKQYVTGKHGRVIGVVFLSQNVFASSLNVELVRLGFAKVYPKAQCSWMTERLYKRLSKAESIAKKKRLRVWDVKNRKVKKATTRKKGRWVGVFLCIALILGGLLFYATF